MLKIKKNCGVSRLGLFQTFSAWNAARFEKHIASMEEKGLCPDCRGRGFDSYAPNEYYYNSVYECSGCNGSGAYHDWAEIQTQQM